MFDDRTDESTLCNHGADNSEEDSSGYETQPMDMGDHVLCDVGGY